MSFRYKNEKTYRKKGVFDPFFVNCEKGAGPESELAEIEPPVSELPEIEPPGSEMVRIRFHGFGLYQFWKILIILELLIRAVLIRTSFDSGGSNSGTFFCIWFPA